MPELRYLTAGESHGEMLTGILDGIPAGLELRASRDIDPMLAERQKGYGRGRRQQIEQDTAKITAGVRHGITTGAPISLLIENKDWKNWQRKMSVEPVEEEIKRVTVPRPGHADYAGAVKYGHEQDIRNVLERASARETAMRVALGAVCQKMLRELDIESIAFVRSIGSIEAAMLQTVSYAEMQERMLVSQLRVIDPHAEQQMIGLIDQAKAAGDTLGGVVECRLTNLPVGVGSQMQWDRKLDGKLAQALMSIQAVKGVEIGAGFTAAKSFGSQVHDGFALQHQHVNRTSNNAGGLEGGMTNGEELIVRMAMKPISTLMSPLHSFDLATGEETLAHIERSDVCAVPALSVIVQAVVSLTITASILETFGGDTMKELQARIAERRSRTILRR